MKIETPSSLFMTNAPKTNSWLEVADGEYLNITKEEE